MANSARTLSAELDWIRVRDGFMELDEYIDRHFDHLYAQYTNNGEMPYGIAKARDGDPTEWIYRKLDSELIRPIFLKKQAS